MLTNALTTMLTRAVTVVDFYPEVVMDKQPLVAQCCDMCIYMPIYNSEPEKQAGVLILRLLHALSVE